MPNFWPFYAVDVTAAYEATPVGEPIRYTYDGQVIELKKNPPPGYSYYLPAGAGGGIMPHDPLTSNTYYRHHAKVGAYQFWPHQVARELNGFSGSRGQIHVTMSGAVVNNVNDLNNLRNVDGYNNPNWGAAWRAAYQDVKTVDEHRGLDLIHFTGHHSMCPLVGPEYCAKDLIYQSVTLAQDYFLGEEFRSSRGFFPTELGFSKRIIPTLAKFGIQWSVIGNNHFSRTLKDYPFLAYYPNLDTLISPPNRADLRNTSTVGEWVTQQMAHEQQQIRNKFPFASTPHWIRHVDPASGKVTRIAGIPVDQAGSWLEGWEGATTVDAYKPYEALEPRQFFVVAHDGDNSSGRAGSLATWQNGHRVTCANGGYCLGIDEYLAQFPIPADDIRHVQDGSWVDTRDSSSDPQWHHWKLPFGIWSGQLAEFNRVTGLDLAPKSNLDGQEEGMTVSLEHGFHYLERNFALLQAALNFAKTAEQIWLDEHPQHWQPVSDLDRAVTHEGNQLNPWMISYPVKGDPSDDYRGGANPAELAWYFLLPAMDSGFGYYDENKDDHVKPTLAFNNSLSFSHPYVTANHAKDRTGPSVWWPQRWPYNPGSVNADKSQGYTVHHYDNVFAIYTYAYDVSGLDEIALKVRSHTEKTIDEADDTYKLYDPAAHLGNPELNITPGNVGEWKTYPMERRDLSPVINGVAWNKVNMETMQILPAREIGDLYYVYLGDYRDQLLDYTIEATDANGNVTRSEIQQVYVGAGRYNKVGDRYVEALDGTIQGTHPFLVEDTEPPTVPGTPVVGGTSDRSATLTWTTVSDNVAVTGYGVYRDGARIATVAENRYTDRGLAAETEYRYSVDAFDAAENRSPQSGDLALVTRPPDTEPPNIPGEPSASAVGPGSVTLHWGAASDNYGVDRYRVHRDGEIVGTAAVPSFTDTRVRPDTSYRYWVIALDAAGNASAPSPATAVGTPPGFTAAVYYRPQATWGMVNIHYAPGGGQWTAVPGLPMEAACSGWRMRNLELGTADGLQAVFNDSRGTWDNNDGRNYHLPAGDSHVDAGRVESGNPCAGGDTAPPSAPAGVHTTQVFHNMVGLAWEAATDNIGVTGYRVLRDQEPVSSTATLELSDPTVTATTRYLYSVRAYDAAGNVSEDSQVLAVTTPSEPDLTPPSVPEDLAVSDLEETALTLTWQASTDNAGVVGYDVYGDTNRVSRVTDGDTRVRLTGLTPGTHYSFSVRAEDAAGNVSAPSEPLSVTTPGGNTARIYYREGLGPQVCLHYRPEGGRWTTPPGKTMEVAAEIQGYRRLDIPLNGAVRVEVAFNDCVGRWDSNQGANYWFATGVSTYDAEAEPRIRTGAPQPPAFATIHYRRADGDYKHWCLHLWGAGLAPGVSTPWHAPRCFEGTDNFGAYTSFALDDASKPVGFIVHHGDAKDVAEDRFFDPAQQGEIWLQQGDSTVYGKESDITGSGAGVSGNTPGSTSP
jgi:chitodextrinase